MRARGDGGYRPGITRSTVPAVLALLRSIVSAVAALLVLGGGGAAGQSPTALEPGVVSVDMSADTVDFGDTFHLFVELHVPAGQTAHVPELVPASDNVEALREAQWVAERRADGSTDVSLQYSLIGYRVGNVDLPAFSVMLGPGGAGDGSGATAPVTLLPDGATLPTGPALFEHRVPGHSVWVMSLLEVDDVVAGLEPRPADDVVGASWNGPAVFSFLAFGTLLLGLAFVSGRDLMAARKRPPPPAAKPANPVETARQAALDALDRLLAEGVGPDLDAFYDRSSSAVRRYVEHLDIEWGPAFTSTELMRGLTAASGAESVGGLKGEMSVAEVVKFGRLRPEEQAALEHCRALRDWVASS